MCVALFVSVSSCVHSENSKLRFFGNNKIGYGEESRQYRRTIYTHADWKKHRRENRFFYNLSTLLSSGIYKQIRRYVAVVTCISTVICVWNGLVSGFMGLQNTGVRGAALLAHLPKLGLPLAPFSLAMPSLGLLLVFRTNTAYARWDEARKNWGLNINRTRDLMRMAAAFHEGQDEERRQSDLSRLALCTWAFVRAMKRHLSPDEEDEKAFAKELADKLPPSQAKAILRARHRPNRALQDLSTAIEALPMHFMRKDRIHSSLTQLEDNLGSSERLLSSPVPLFYTRHTTRFLAVFVLLLPLALYDAFAGSWNAISMIPATAIISTCLFGIDELATQLEEPFTILPMQAFCDKIHDACTEIVEFDADPLLPRQQTTTPSSKRTAASERNFVHPELAEANHEDSLLLPSKWRSSYNYDDVHHDDTLMPRNNGTSGPPINHLFRRAVAKAASQALP